MAGSARPVIPRLTVGAAGVFIALRGPEYEIPVYLVRRPRRSSRYRSDTTRDVDTGCRLERVSDAPPERPNRRGGRPRLPPGQEGSAVSVWLHPAEHDKLIALANRREQSISAVVRDLLRLRVK